MLLLGSSRNVIVSTGWDSANPADSVDVAFATQTLGTAGAVASTLRPGGTVSVKSRSVTAQAQNLTTSDAVTFVAHSGTSYSFDKYVGVDTALTSSSPESSAIAASRDAATQGWSRLFADHAAAWSDLWASDITVVGQPDLQDWIRSNLYALWSSIRAGADDSISPVGLSSDNYAGLIFWDAETWMYPSLLLMHPDVAESIVEYRRKTMPGARANAQELRLPGHVLSRGTAPGRASSTRSATAGTRRTA